MTSMSSIPDNHLSLDAPHNKKCFGDKRNFFVMSPNLVDDGLLKSWPVHPVLTACCL